MLDAEHGAHSFEALDTLILTAYASDVTPIVRVNENTPGLIMRVLDIGETAPRWGQPGANSDDCPSPPGPTDAGCVVSSRLVKLTVNFDDPSSYHLYYGDELGRPGTIMTFFAWPGAPGKKDPQLLLTPARERSW